MPYDTLLFDFDGVLINSYTALLYAYKTISVELFGKELDVNWFKEIDTTNYNSTFAEMGITDSQKDQAVEIISRHYKQELLKIEIPDNLIETINILAESFPKIGICSTNHNTTIESKLHPVNSHFKTIIGHADIKEVNEEGELRIKPDPYPLNLAMQELNSSPDRTIFLGDSINDLLAARGAGCYIGLCLWFPYETEKSLRALKPDAFFNSPEELLILKALSK